MAATPTLPVIVNAGGGAARRAGAGLAESIEAAFAEAGQAIALELVDGKDLSAAFARHADAPRLVAGGGDGTLAAAAAARTNCDGELAILPLGTLNHFAREIGIPADLRQAAALAAGGAARPVDIACAGERVFINNLSVGAYVDLVRAREASSLPKFVATVPAAWRTLRKLRARSFDLTSDGDRCQITTPLLFVGNNRYQLDEGRPAERAALDDGLLSLYAVAPLPRTALIAAALRTLAGRPRIHRDFVLDETARKVVIEGSGRTLDAALDGERCRFELPLAIHILPRALAVVAPPDD